MTRRVRIASLDCGVKGLDGLEQALLETQRGLAEIPGATHEDVVLP